MCPSFPILFLLFVPLSFRRTTGCLARRPRDEVIARVAIRLTLLVLALPAAFLGFERGVLVTWLDRREGGGRGAAGCCFSG